MSSNNNAPPQQPRSKYSPLSCLSPAPLTPSGLVKIDPEDGEVELLARSNVEFRSTSPEPLPHIPLPNESPKSPSDWIDRDVDVTCHFTTHRIVLVETDENDQSKNRAYSIDLALVASAGAEGGPSFRSPFSTYKLSIRTHHLGEFIIAYRSNTGSSSTTSSMSECKKDRDDALSSLQKSLSRKAWEEKAKSRARQSQSAASKVTKRKVGVDAIVTKSKLREKEAKRVTDEAFADGGDVEILMKEATELVNIIKRYAATLERQQRDEAGIRGGRGGGEAKEDEADAAKLGEMLESMGMASALSKKQAAGGGGGGVYYQTLARQLCDFLHHGDRLTDAGGMMTLTDVYCLFNRARGTNMIAPEDLLKACHWMKELKLGMSKREFPSGVVVIQDDSFDDDVMANKLKVLAVDSEKNGGMTALDASRNLKVSAMLATEQLLNAERMGYLCRDVTLEGMRFFPNRFVTGDFGGQ